jgi:hypothetical protein
MSDPSATNQFVAGPRTISLEVRLRALESVGYLLDAPMPRIRDERLCWDFTRIIDGLLTNVARGRGALEVAIGEGLESLAVGDRVFEVGGYCNVPDCARERYGLPASTAVKMMRFARELRKRPLLREAVRSGTVSVSQAEAVLPVAIGDAERLWVARASIWTVRALDVAVKTGRLPTDDVDAIANGAAAGPERVDAAAFSDCAPSSDERWTRLLVDVPIGGQAVIDEGIALGRRALDRPEAPKWQVLEAVAAEFLNGSDAAAEFLNRSDAASCAHPEPFADTRATPREDAPSDAGSIEILGESLDEHCAYWASLVQVPNIEAPLADAALVRDARLIDARLQRHIRALEQWDLLFGHLALISRNMRCWEIAGFASLGHYCVERLGMATRTVEQRIALEERLHDLPTLRAAMKGGRTSYEKARILARHSDRVTVDFRIEQAQGMSCVELRRLLERDEEAQMSARRKFKAVVPCRVASDLDAAFHVARVRAGTPLSSGECLVVLFAHFAGVWKPILARRATLQRKVLERDGYLCRVPGCSRAANHAHHIIPRSAGGPDEMWNLTSVCAAHHLRGIHGGKVRVSGRAPDQLRWTLDGALPEVEGRWSAVRAAA